MDMRLLRALVSMILCLMMTGIAMAEDLRLPPRYPKTEAGESIVNDVEFSAPPVDNGMNRVFYEIFVGSFSDSDGDGIGDLRGIINRMDYLNDGDPTSGVSLGVEGIWLTPVFASPSYHKYDVADFYTIDPAFGTLEDLKELAALCHQRGVLLILDLPINHTSTLNAWFTGFASAHICHNASNRYYDWYTWIGPDDAVPAGRYFARLQGSGDRYEANFSDSMPELNFANPAVREAVLDVAKFYLELGVDGFRFDAAKYIDFGDHASSIAFWKWYIGELKRIKPDIYTVAEVWDDEGITDRYTAIVNCFNFTASQASGIIAETAKAGNVNRYTAYLEKRMAALGAIGPDARNIMFIANHDTDRAAGYLTVASGYMKMAANLYLLAPGSPFIYYGEEIGLRGSRGSANTDANRRLAMLWGDGDTVRDPEGTTYDPKKQTPYSVLDLYPVGDSIYNYYKRLIMIRRANPEIANGTLTAFTIPDTKAGGFLAEWQGSTVAVLHNTTLNSVTIDLQEITDIGFAAISAVIGAEAAELKGSILTIGAQTSVVLR